MSVLKIVKGLLYKLGVARYLSKRRFIVIDRILNNELLGSETHHCKHILDVGCGIGKDFVSFLKERSDIEIIGLDLKDYYIKQNNFSMIVGDAENISFEDNYFDLTVSIGVLEHIKPMEKLCKVIKEINRVSKAYVVIVPAINTLVEPHTAQFLWQFRAYGKKRTHTRLNYMSDEAWLSFEGFSDAKVIRYSHIPFFIKDLVIYKV